MGCIYFKVINYNVDVEVDDGSCIYLEFDFNNVINIFCIEEKINLGEKVICKVIISVLVVGDYNIVVDGG